MELLEALKKANDYFLRTCNEGVNKAGILDAKTHWIFYPRLDNTVELGLGGLKIEKNTGIMEDFILPDDNNFELLDQSTKIELEK